ncbi:DUF6174 domain-containing protein [Streptomyces europaeiscabiei]|uniref:DUF6174 domain-containing protein n=2 Tax=Streptomyces europaeiscabiei TaxID=146819 RepID=UPI0029ABE658|nr:DUF6174 domain-containing protein [Streptomyces europaeiscabiei]MDX3619532.1 DUF6174 domain-containing protein [Streptomyces europaeiscabiei]MDX3629814.1 DUF6174 domain-containing protein [Streptomyces europaeiscabiei]MDX3648431.1 DUF6174 domain-containing protein [Streptomyces europaeiscabiei]WUD33111.1 DUF6174 domain-containing protein [Streptomyces europaeiscabiei]
MTVVRFRARSVFLAAALIAGTVGASAACDGETSPESTGKASAKGTTAQNKITWHEPASYVYTLTSTSQVLAGTFRVTVRDGKVAEAVGLDDDSRWMVEQGPDRIPKIGELLDRLEKAWDEQADTAEVEYAPDGRPSRITLDQDENAIDDEAEYVISGYEPGDDRGPSYRGSL